MLIVCPVIGGSVAENVSEQVEMVSPNGLTKRNVIEHGGQEIGTVGINFTATDESLSRISSLSLS